MAGSEERSPSYEDLLEANRRLERENERLRKEIQKLRRLVEDLQRRSKRQAAPFSKGEPKRDPKKAWAQAGRRPRPKLLARAPVALG